VLVNGNSRGVAHAGDCVACGYILAPGELGPQVVSVLVERNGLGWSLTPSQAVALMAQDTQV